MKTFTDKINKSYEIGLQNLNSELIYITENGNQVGSLILIYNENVASIFSVSILNSYRGKGYGKRLVENAISRCKERNCKSIELNTEIDNKIANNLYQSIGFELKGIKNEFNNYLLII